MTLIGRQRVPFGNRIEIGGELRDNLYNGRPWNYQRYQSAVRRHLGLIRLSRTGQHVMNALSRKVLIVPRVEQDSNAVARPVRDTSVGFRMHDAPGSDFMAANSSTMHGVSRIGATGPMRNTPLGVITTGTGGGADTVIEYTPGFYAPGALQSDISAVHGRGTEYLLHELVHAVMMTNGVDDPRTTSGAAAAYENRAEFNAIMVANIFRSETNPQTPLRASHDLDSFDVMQDPEGFYRRHMNLVTVFRNKLPTFADNLADIDARFNPLRQHRAARSAQPAP